MVNITIDGIQVRVRENTTIMEAAAQCRIEIPRLCYLKEIMRSPPAASAWWNWREKSGL